MNRRTLIGIGFYNIGALALAHVDATILAGIIGFILFILGIYMVIKNIEMKPINAKRRDWLIPLVSGFIGAGFAAGADKDLSNFLAGWSVFAVGILIAMYFVRNADYTAKA